MSAMLAKCEVCGGLLDEEDLFCANCGREAPAREAAPRDRSRQSTGSFQCAGCGASMSYDASAKSLRCPFCGSERLEKTPARATLAPQRVAPFEISRSQAEDRLRGWLKKGFWRPDDLSDRAAVVAMTPVYLPYWVFCARTHTFYTADTDNLPIGGLGDWRPVFGEHRGEYAGLLVGGSSVLSEIEIAEISPFDLDRAVAPNEVDLDNVTVEQFALGRKYARPLARSGLEAAERGACDRLVAGKTRNLKVNLLIEGLTSEPVLLPAWIMAYRYRDRVFRFLVNGQTGKATGEAPVSWFKIARAVGVGLVVTVIVLAVLAGLLGR